MKQITYTSYKEPDFNHLLTMGQKLWPDFNKSELQILIEQATQTDKYNVLIAKDTQDNYVGFAIFSIRTDYVEGAEQSPTGYLEGIFVEIDFRKLGVAKEFVHIGEAWCKEKGCSQIGSDTWLKNKESREFHKKIGFHEEEEIVCFLKNIK